MSRRTPNGERRPDQVLVAFSQLFPLGIEEVDDFPDDVDALIIEDGTRLPKKVKSGRNIQQSRDRSAK
jgi:hypothetical protein